MKKGFTLMELMIVISIIGILAAIAIPNVLRLQCKSLGRKLDLSENLTSEICSAEGGREALQKARDGELNIHEWWLNENPIPTEKLPPTSPPQIQYESSEIQKIKNRLDTIEKSLKVMERALSGGQTYENWRE